MFEKKGKTNAEIRVKEQNSVYIRWKEKLKLGVAFWKMQWQLKSVTTITDIKKKNIVGVNLFK